MPLFVTEDPEQTHTVMPCPGPSCDGTISNLIVETYPWAFGTLALLEPCPKCGREIEAPVA